jgi:hypothetical protein
MAAFAKPLRPCVLLLIAFIPSSGCGLSDYQQRMDAQRVRIQKFDDTNNLLDDPIEMPIWKTTTEEKNAWPFDVFLRLPKGFGTAPREKTPYYVNFAFFRYNSHEPAYSIFIVAADVALDAKQETFGKYLPDKFRRYVGEGLKDFYRKKYKAELVLPEKEELRAEPIERVALYPDDLKPILYRTCEYRDTSNPKAAEPSTFRLHLHESEGKQICIVEQRPLRTPNETFDKAMRASLGTLEFGEAAANKRAQFKKMKGN